MKNLNSSHLVAILCLIISPIFVSCEEQEREVNLLDNEEQREEVYQQILADEELFNEFLDEMRDNRQMMRNIYTREQVEATMMADPEVIDSVLVGLYAVIDQDSMLLRDPARREQMMQNIMNMVERDTAMYGEMRERMEERRMN
ncbi:hypothetical protein [Salinimicrobium terrae]|uniref:hypothetical protein n=1 Tax=Salinimicrobium terrae TaxID=470866 RepID=UPI000404DDFB|nr:hypothetical protein [Salinimicrobium terrae]